ncbi:hypothetical protein [Mucilaginibacter segetis]|uniref:Uncharacterized protein n=1 Tax=Mucilaginibacter segetis TaxID=2793071 RepID=A0A934PTU0_9SPHI|nr:hypothetical protein [Mucilaginibacter segetis]MBK0379471.1 hypothetical protein [Mucilaginibacter segetis]
MKIKSIPFVLFCIILLCSFTFKKTLTGVWEYAGGIYNGKIKKQPEQYKLERIYDDRHYRAVFMEDDEQPVTYEEGDYQLKKDSCFESQTYSRQPTQLTGIVMHYQYSIRNDTLTLSGTLPNGTTVKEYWKKIK